jgi:alkylation response protein AidB-like acyl-CoA dehydrogenase
MTTTIDDPTPIDGSAVESISGDSPEQAAFRTRVRAFLEANAKPKQDKGPWGVTFHTDPEEARAEFEEGKAWQHTRAEHGLVGFTYPREYGGQGGEAWMERIYNEEALNYGSSSGFVNATIAMLGPTLMAFGTEEQKRTLLPRLL